MLPGVNRQTLPAFTVACHKTDQRLRRSSGHVLLVGSQHTSQSTRVVRRFSTETLYVAWECIIRIVTTGLTVHMCIERYRFGRIQC